MYASRRFLFRTIRVQDISETAVPLITFYKFTSFMGARPHLATLVRELHMTGKDDRQMRPHLLGSLLTSLTALEALYLYGCYVDGGSLSETSMLRSRFSLKVLHVDCCNSKDSDGFMDLIGILSMFSEIMSLSISTIGRSNITVSSGTILPEQSYTRPRIIHLQCREMPTWMADCFMEYILQSVPESPLLRLSFEASFRIPLSLFTVVRAAGAHLQYLDLHYTPSFNTAENERWAAGLSGISVCTALQRFTIWTPLVILPPLVPANWSILLQILERLPRILRSLCFRFPKHWVIYPSLPPGIIGHDTVFQRWDNFLTQFSWAQPVTFVFARFPWDSEHSQVEGLRLRDPNEFGPMLASRLPNLHSKGMLEVSYEEGSEL
ncbi:unnamed protein product [Somion occarium]